MSIVYRRDIIECAHLCIKLDEDISPVAIHSSDPHPEIWLLFLEFDAIRAGGGLGGYEAWLWLTINSWFSAIWPI